MREGFSDIEESMESIELWFTSVAEEAAGGLARKLFAAQERIIPPTYSL